MSQNQTQLIEDNTLFSISSDSAILKFNGQANSRLLFSVPNFINTTNNIQATFFSIQSAVIPASFYNINSNNNLIYINDQQYGFIPGNYNVTQMLTMMNANLPTGYYFEYNSIKNTMQLFAPVLEWSIQPTKSTCYRLIGWNNTDNFTFSMRDQYASPNVVNLLTTPRIFIRSSQIDCNNYDDENVSSDVLGVIPNTACLNGVIHYVNYNGVSHLVEKDVVTFDLQITDDEKQLIDFRGVPIYITFAIKTLREVVKPPTFQDMFRQATASDLSIYNSQKAIEPESIYL